MRASETTSMKSVVQAIGNSHLIRENAKVENRAIACVFGHKNKRDATRVRILERTNERARARGRFDSIGADEIFIEGHLFALAKCSPPQMITH